MIKIDGLEKIVSLGKDNAEALVQSGNATLKGFEEIAKAGQVMAAKSAERVDGALKALFACKTPVELADLQSRLARESIESAIAESRKFAELTTAVVSAAFEPLNARFAAFQSLVKSAA